MVPYDGLLPLLHHLILAIAPIGLLAQCIFTKRERSVMKSWLTGKAPDVPPEWEDAESWARRNDPNREERKRILAAAAAQHSEGLTGKSQQAMPMRPILGRRSSYDRAVSSVQTAKDADSKKKGKKEAKEKAPAKTASKSDQPKSDIPTPLPEMKLDNTQKMIDESKKTEKKEKYSKENLSMARKIEQMEEENKKLQEEKKMRKKMGGDEKDTWDSADDSAVSDSLAKKSARNKSAKKELDKTKTKSKQKKKGAEKETSKENSKEKQHEEDDDEEEEETSGQSKKKKNKKK